MAYHSTADMVPDRLDEATAIQLSNDDADAVTVNEDRLSAAADDAAAEIDGYIGARYALPLESTPPIISRLSMTIAIYHLFDRRYAEGAPEGIRTRYEDARRTLEQISRGVVTLGVQPALAQNAQRRARVSGGSPRFSKSTLADA